MSQYNYSYGQYPGLPPPPPNQYQYGYPNPVAYNPAPNYGSPPDPNAQAPSSYSMMQTGFDRSSSTTGIPGLGIVGAPPAGLPYQPPPAIPSWGHQAHQAINPPFVAGTPFVAGAPDAPPQYHYSTPTQFGPPAADQPSRPPSFVSNNNQALPSKAVSHPINAATESSDEMEEGELSEGQFEDLYEPVDSSAKPKDTPVAPNMVVSSSGESQPHSTVDTPDGGFYTNEEDDSESRNRPMAGVDTSAGARTNTQNGGHWTTARERSGSYSPYLSPREIQDVDAAENSGRSLQVEPSTVNGSGHPGAPVLRQTVNDASDASTSNRVLPAISAPSQTSTSNSNNNNDSAAMSGFKSLAEAKKEAQKAILRLWPLGVKFQHYIDEGLDENVVKLLFSELHLDMSTGKAIQPDTAHPSQPPVISESRAPAAATTKPPTEPKSLAQSQSTKPPEGDKMDKSEERKDRIARLLALKTAKGAASLPISAPTPASALAQSSTGAQISTQTTASSAALVPAQAQAPAPAVTNPTATSKSSATSTPTAPKPKTKEEMERLLRQKLEALQQKSRPLGIPKTDSDKAASSAAKSSGPVAADSVTLPPTTATVGGVSAAIASPQQQSKHEAGLIPGLFLPSATQAAQTVNVRKRPVASDFVDYSSTSESRKRPFGQERQNSSLVIDVSDASDDEEMDIDMEMDSPTEAPVTLQRSDTPGRKGPSLAEFPPLRDLSRRNVSSPVPSQHATPGGFLSAKEKELLAKEKAIQEMRRKIAEAEAKRKAKKGGSQTPNQAVTTPSESTSSESSVANDPRATSVSADKAPEPPAQPISEVVSAKLPEQSELAPNGNPRPEGSRVVSPDVQRVDTALGEKKKRLAALREEREARIREAEARIQAERARIREEEARLQEEETRLEAELDREMEEQQMLDDEADQSEHMSIDEQPAEESPKGREEQQDGDPQAAASPQKHLLETREEALSPVPLTSTEAREPEQAPDVTTDAHDIPMSDGPQYAVEGVGASQAAAQEDSHSVDISQAPASTFDDGHQAPDTSHNQDLSNSSQEQVDDSTMNEDAPIVMAVPVAEQAPTASLADSTTKEASTTGTVQPEQESRSDSYEPPESVVKDSVDHVAIPDSPEFSPEPAGNPSAGHSEAQIGEHVVPATISDVPQSRDEQQEIERVSTREAKQVPPQKRNSSFVPYESPLRYFRAFKFHPEFNKVVPGGVKSLTYSNKIDPRKEICPTELLGGACPRGNACEFQHLSSIGISDEQILVELGKADDYTGEQKSRFIQGLRELLQNFRANQVRDFDTIAHGIIEFRSRFLGDKSRILPLDGVTL